MQGITKSFMKEQSDDVRRITIRLSGGDPQRMAERWLQVLVSASMRGVPPLPALPQTTNTLVM